MEKGQDWSCQCEETMGKPCGIGWCMVSPQCMHIDIQLYTKVKTCTCRCGVGMGTGYTGMGGVSTKFTYGCTWYLCYNVIGDDRQAKVLRHPPLLEVERTFPFFSCLLLLVLLLLYTLVWPTSTISSSLQNFVKCMTKPTSLQNLLVQAKFLSMTSLFFF